ncbi:MAG: hypothetical protein H0T73_16550, partial [Ardenticatenales bacterium]|nr:hypothetical protein [Ardenticatenales bacterium]
HDLAPLAPATAGQFRLVAETRLYDNGTMIRHSKLLDGRRAQPYVKLNPLDAGTLEVVEGDRVTVTSGNSQMTVPLRVDASLQPGVALLPLDVADGAFNGLAENTIATLAKAVTEFA